MRLLFDDLTLPGRAREVTGRGDDITKAGGVADDDAECHGAGSWKQKRRNDDYLLKEHKVSALPQPALTRMTDERY